MQLNTFLLLFQDNQGAGLLNTLSRRASLRHRVHQPQPRPPSYPAVAGGRSFDPNEFGDDSDEEGPGLTVAPPPQYTDIVYVESFPEINTPFFPPFQTC